MLKEFAVEVTEKQWHLMWDHIVCQFTKLYGDNAVIYPMSPDEVEFIALHKAYAEIASIPQPWSDWQWPVGQQIAIILKQLEARLKGAHHRVPAWHCESSISSFCIHMLRQTTATGGVIRHTLGFHKQPFQEFLTKEEAASIVCGERLKQGRPTFGMDYDPIIRAELTKRGVELLPEGANCELVEGANMKRERKSMRGLMGRLWGGKVAGSAREQL